MPWQGHQHGTRPDNIGCAFPELFHAVLPRFERVNFVPLVSPCSGKSENAAGGKDQPPPGCRCRSSVVETPTNGMLWHSARQAPFCNCSHDSERQLAKMYDSLWP